MIRLNELVTDAGTQMRERISAEQVEEYKQAMMDGDEFPKLIVFNAGGRLILADGFHRLAAMLAKGQEWADVDLREGTVRDAILFALKANSKRGLPRTRADKRKAVNYVLDNPDYVGLNNNNVAAMCGVTSEFVRQMRLERDAPAKAAKPQKEKAPVEKSNIAEPEEFDERDEVIDGLAAELETAKVQLAAKALDEDQRDEALEFMQELRDENKMLRSQLEAVKKSRDQYMAENAQLKKQVAMQLKKMKAAGI
jgi:hypothetical protein